MNNGLVEILYYQCSLHDILQGPAFLMELYACLPTGFIASEALLQEFNREER